MMNAVRQPLIPSLLVALFLGAAWDAPARAPAPPAKGKTARIANYDYKLPPWWHKVRVDVPRGLKNAGEVDAFVAKEYGKDTGTRATWKAALKAHAIAAQRLKRFPVYVAHCHMAGEDYARAAEVYGDLYALAGTQGKHTHWYRCYLAYNAGEAYAKLKDNEKAKAWYARAAEYRGHSDSAIAYYAAQSAKAVEKLNGGK